MTDKELEEFIDVGENKFIELAMIFGDAWPSKAIQIAAEYKALLAQPDDDAVAWVDEITLRDLKNGKEGVHLVYEEEMIGSIPLFEYPPEKEWVGLTDKEVVILAYQSQENECTAIRLAEQALKEKNT